MLMHGRIEASSRRDLMSLIAAAAASSSAELELPPDDAPREQTEQGEEALEEPPAEREGPAEGEVSTEANEKPISHCNSVAEFALAGIIHFAKELGSLQVTD